MAIPLTLYARQPVSGELTLALDTGYQVAEPLALPAGLAVLTRTITDDDQHAGDGSLQPARGQPGAW